jgi:cobalamin biosynthesis protein CbiD
MSSVETNASLAALEKALKELGEKIMRKEITIEEAMLELERIAFAEEFEAAWSFIEERVEKEVARARRLGLRL